MAASVFQSTTVGHARITVASPTGIELARMAVFFLRLARAICRASKLSLIGLTEGHDSLRSGPTLNKE